MTGDQNDMLTRLKAMLPSAWFPVSQPGQTSQSPVLDGLLSGSAALLSQSYALLQWVRSQARIATASGVFLDMVSSDFFGSFLSRRSGETDAHLAARIDKELFREKGTRNGLVQALTDLTGRAPTVFEPKNTMDTGGYGSMAGVRRNLISNSTASGAVAGATGTPPTNWNITRGDGGITQTIVTGSTDSGVPCLDITFAGTPVASNYIHIWFDVTGGVGAPVLPSLTYTLSFYAALRSGALPGTPFVQVNIFDVGGGSIGAYTGPSIVIPSGALAQVSAYTRLNNSNVYHQEPLLRIPFTGGVPVNFTLRIGGPILELGAVAGAYIATSTGPVTIYPAANTGLAYGLDGGYGSLALPFQFFLTAYRPLGQGVANVAGYGDIAASITGMPGGYGSGSVEYASPSMFAPQIADSDILNVINDVRPAATAAWVRLSN